MFGMAEADDSEAKAAIWDISGNEEEDQNDNLIKGQE